MGKLSNEEILDVILTKKLQDRFWKLVDKSVGDDKCWIKKRKPGKSPQKNEHWSFHIKNETKMDAHLVSLIIKLKYLPEADALHEEWICKGEKRCVNPKHLYEGTASQNRRDENTAGKTFKHKKARKNEFIELIERSTLNEKMDFYKYLQDELFPLQTKDF